MLGRSADRRRSHIRPDATLNDPNATLSVSATFVLGGGLTISQGTPTISTFNVLIFPQTLTNDGTILSTGLGAFSSLFDTSRGFTNNGTMSIDTFSGSFVNRGSISVADFGVLTITENAVFDNPGLITLASGADLHPLHFLIELEEHDILWADGLPVESLIPRGDRSAFENGGALVQLHPDFHSLAWEAEGCAPLVVTGPRLDAARARLAARVDHLASRVSREAGAA